jgi:predicted DNA-binding protein with PD1-like motif
MAGHPLFREFKTGRCFLGRLGPDADLFDTVNAFCRRRAIATAVFRVVGTVSTATLGTYDPRQQVFVTRRVDEPLEMVCCNGNVSLQAGMPVSAAHGVLCSHKGQVFGGRLFSKTLFLCGEIDLKEWVGQPWERAYDPQTGLDAWREDRLKTS